MTNIYYWIFTGLFAAMILRNGGVGIFPPDAALEKNGFENVDYALCSATLVKWLGVAVILSPGFSRLKEWAYAGLMADLIGSFFPSIIVGQWSGAIIFKFLLFSLGVFSYIFFRKRLAISLAEK